jgi:DNA repair exonuclease SbcCD ATPase subunit|tara:strand:- start:3016 stop:4692 length:1677 start_codon:yes stop_codon:yes gene_type:complete
MIVFETIRWKNFLSTGDQWTEIGLNDSMSTLVIGDNGAGKSTMLDALCFALFNKPFRKIKKSQLVNSINEKGLKVEVTFSIAKDDYRVFRGIKPNTFEVYKNNKMVDQDAATKDTQKYLEQSVLKLNFKSFTQVVILGSSTFVPFMQLGASTRREVIEDLLDIQIFSNMNLLLKDRMRAVHSRVKECEVLLNLSQEKVSGQKKLIASLKEVNETRQKEKQDKYDENQSIIDKNTKSLEMLKIDTEALEEHTDILNNLRDSQADTRAELKKVTKEFKFLETNDECPTCTQVIGEEFKTSRMTVLQDRGVDLTKVQSQTKKSIDDVVDIIDKLDSVTREVQELSGEVIRLEKENVNIQKSLTKLESTPNIDKEKKILDELLSNLDKTQYDCGQVRQTLDEYVVVSNLLKDSGIKSQIIKKYIPIFNQLINKYLHSMDTFFNFTLDEEFNEVIKSRFRDEFSYSSFSEGEKQKIDLALLFTWREVARMKNSAATNLLILDEVFDSSLDAGATNELISILRSLGKGTNLYVISHKGDLLHTKFMRTIKFEKINDFSKMSDDS